MADAPLSPTTGKPMIRGIRPVEISYRGRSKTVEMPGWFCDASGESIHSRADMKLSDLALMRLKAEAMNPGEAHWSALRRSGRQFGVKERGKTKV